jgi:hypothetical protein
LPFPPSFLPHPTGIRAGDVVLAVQGTDVKGKERKKDGRMEGWGEGRTL